MRKLFLLVAVLASVFAGAQTTPQHRVDLSWNASTTTGVTSYNVYRAQGNCATVPAASFVLVGTANGTTFSDTTVNQAPPTAGISYCYAVTAINSGIESVFSNFAQAVLLPFPPAPNPPTNLIAKPF